VLSQVILSMQLSFAVFIAALNAWLLVQSFRG
jgi:hypothetical protein